MSVGEHVPALLQYREEKNWKPKREGRAIAAVSVDGGKGEKDLNKLTGKNSFGLCADIFL